VGALSSGKGATGGDGDAMDLDGPVNVVTKETIEEIAGTIPEETIDGLLNTIQPRKNGAVYASTADVVQDIVADGWSATQVLTQLYDKIIYDERITDLRKGKIAMVFSETDKRLVDGADEHLCILDLVLRISSILSSG
jgi:replication factor C subunit 2/4